MMLNLSKDADDFLQDLQLEQLQRNAHPADAKHLSGYYGYQPIDSGKFCICYTVINRSIFLGKRTALKLIKV